MTINTHEQISPDGGEGQTDLTVQRCTSACAKLSSLTLVNGKLPNHEQLASHLGLNNSSNSQPGLSLGTLSDLRQRKDDCAICQLVLSAMDSNKTTPPEPDECEGQAEGQQEISLLLFPTESSLRLSYPSRLGTRLSFLASSESEISSPDAARPLVLPTNITGIDTAKIQSWLKKCEDCHGARCYPTLADDVGRDADSEKMAKRPEVLRIHPRNFNESATSNFRVIDLEEMCIVPQRLDVKYVALSYVWGQLPMFRLLKSNYDELRRQGGLLGVMDKLPRTITDAMRFVREVGARYLWVDALCLVQDDQRDVELGIEVMNSVYAGSWFTVVAASGGDAGGGLGGVEDGDVGERQGSQMVVNLGEGGLKMTVQHSIDWHLRRSVYNSRGWTLQELVLPRRTVVFVNNQVYFRCQEANWSEETTADAFDRYLDPDDGNISRIPDPVSEGGVRSWWAYQKLMEEYSARSIRFDGDTLRASAGLLRPLCAGMETRMLEGLPGNYLDNALLFISSSGDMRRRPGFASWSWAGWQGRVMWPRENYVWFDDQGRRTWDVDNLFRWFEGNTWINWSYLSVNASRQHLMADDDYKEPRFVKSLERIVRQFPHLKERLGPFDLGSMYDLTYSSGGSWGPFIPNWKLDGVRRPWNHAAFDLANSQAEFTRLMRNVEQSGNRSEYLTLMNWMAGRRAHTSMEQGRALSSDDETTFLTKWLVRATGSFKAAVKKSEEPPRPRSIGRFSERLHYRFRPDDEVTKPREDAREQMARRGDAYKKCPDMVIPRFPPYAVLFFQTLSLNLALGQPPDLGVIAPKPSGTTSSFQRIPGIPLLSSTSEVVGSLHPDSLDLLPPTGSTVELALTSHCQALTWNSALGHGDKTVTDPDESVGDEPLELFWALYIVWTDGIAFRRGVAQLLASSVGKSLAPGPEVKEIFLG